MKLQKEKSNQPNIKARVRNPMPLHLVRGEKRDIYQHNEIVWLTDAEAKQYQHLIEIEES
ncbi:MAG: hypothetical protein RLZZ381_885 [Cyanobacteriota bacterium]|jgi:hypothetical protein